MVLRIIFSIILVLIIIAAVVMVVYTPLKHLFQKRHLNRSIGRKLYKLAIDNDYLLVHNYKFRIDDNAALLYDHILFGDKFFYCIMDYAYEGGIVGELNDEKWYHYGPKSKNPVLVNNPVLRNFRRMEKFSLVTGLDKHDLIAITIVNDNCLISDKVQINSDHDYLIHVGELDKLIKKLESREIGKIDSAQIEQVVAKQIVKTNIFKKRRSKI